MNLLINIPYLFLGLEDIWFQDPYQPSVSISLLPRNLLSVSPLDLQGDLIIVALVLQGFTVAGFRII